jgi:hypothetical protein
LGILPIPACTNCLYQSAACVAPMYAGIYTYAWPLPLTLEGVRKIQANPPQPPRGSGFSGPWAKAMAEAQAQAQAQQKRAATSSGGGEAADGEADVKVGLSVRSTAARPAARQCSSMCCSDGSTCVIYLDALVTSRLTVCALASVPSRSVRPQRSRAWLVQARPQQHSLRRQRLRRTPPR